MRNTCGLNKLIVGGVFYRRLTARYSCR